MHDLNRLPADNVIDAPFGPALLELRDLSFSVRGQSLIDGVSLKLRAGRRTIILGPNGAGKSLLLRLMHGLIQPDAGQVLWQGRPLSRQACSRQALVFQKPVLLRRSVLANLRFALAANGVARRDRGHIAQNALELANIETLAHRPARLLSGGEQQRLAVARALSCMPELLLLDEPTANLDPASTARIEALLDEAQNRGVTVVMVTHDQGQARRLAEDIVFVQNGRIAEAGPAAQVLNSPSSPATRAWLSGQLYLPQT